MNDTPDHKPDPDLIHMLVQHGDLPAFEIPKLLMLLAADAYARRPLPDPANDQATSLDEALAKLTQCLDAYDQVKGEIQELRAKLDELPALPEAAPDDIAKADAIEKRLDAIDKALAKLKPKHAPKPADEPAPAA